MYLYRGKKRVTSKLKKKKKKRCSSIPFAPFNENIYRNSIAEGSLFLYNRVGEKQDRQFPPAVGR